MIYAKKIVQYLIQKKQTVSIAESCTGGWVSKNLTDIPGASKVFGFGVISYTAKAKEKLLRIPTPLIRKHGEVSAEVALAMAQGIQKISGSDYAFSITGIAGPTGGTRQKPVGTVYFALLSKNQRHIKKYVFGGNRLQVRKKASETILKLFYRILKNNKRKEAL